MQCNWEISEEAPPIPTPKKAPPQPPPDPMKSTSDKEPMRVSYLTEQTSHHPPVSAYYIDCPEKGLHAQGYDQITAKFTGRAVRVSAGNHNKGIFITLSKRDNEEYQLTHPAANLSGLYTGSLYIAVADTCYITCPKTRLKTILNYYDDTWISRSQNKVKGIIFKYDPKNDNTTQIKDVPEKDVLVKLEGCWQDKIYYWFNSEASKTDKSAEVQKQLLLDLVPLMPVPKICPPPEEQLPNESRRFWKDVTDAIQEKRFNEATKFKQDLEQRQRDKAAERKAQGDVKWKPRFFTEVTEDGGQPHLSEDGRQAVDGMLKKQFQLKESAVLGA